jgi:signal transduction histidine kinase
LPDIWIEANNAVDYFHELLTNATKAIREALSRGEIIDEGRIEVLGRPAGTDRIELLFTNNGPPIPPDRYERIFEQFSGYSTEQESNSFGLGLWGARTFFRRQGGDVLLTESSEDRTTFTVRLPTV